MSRQFYTDGLMVVPSDNEKPITLNAFESIECAIAFDVRDWSEDRRSAWIYAIVFGWEDSWDEIAEKFGWDEEDRKRASMMHEQWMKANRNMDERDVAKKPMRSTEARYGMGYDYHDWICPSCKYFLTYEPNWRNIPKRCPECGQLLDKLTREEAEE